MPRAEIQSEEGKSPARQKQRRWTMATATVTIAILPFALLEVGLRVFGVGEEEVDLHDGFGAAIPLFTLDEEEGIWRTSLPRQRFFVPQEFTAKKPTNEFRIFCLGGSTVQGRPYEPATSFTKWMELELSAIDSDRNYRIVNCGGVSYASYRLRPIMNEVLRYQPDLILLATGHNEFLEARTYAALKTRSAVRMGVENAAKSLRTVMLLRKLTGGSARVEPKLNEDAPSQTVEARLDDDSGYASYHRDDEWQYLVCEHYTKSVRDMFTACAKANVPVIALKLGSNLRDCPPFKSEHLTELKPSDEQKWQELFDRATSTETDDVEAALSLYRQAEQIDGRFPLLHFRIARCLDLLDRPGEAAASYDRALQEDICPLRMISAVQERLVAASDEFGVPLIDAQAAISACSPDGIPGYDAYVDHVHPTIGSHQLIGSAIVQQMIDVNLISPDSRLTAPQRRQLQATHLSSLSNVYFSNGRRRIGWLEGWARRKRLFDETVPVDTRGYTVTALRHLDLHQFDLAGDNLQMAVATDESADARIISIAAKLFSQGRTSAVRWIFNQLQIASVSQSAQKSMDIAELVLACESRNSEVARTVVERREDWEELVTNDSSGWVKAMPDVLAQTSHLLTDFDH